jgi:hypothetical protein
MGVCVNTSEVRKNRWKLDSARNTWRKKHEVTHVPVPSATLRTKVPGSSADVRLCRLRAKVPAMAAPAPIRLPGDNREPGRARGVLLVVDERGRVEDEASLGSTEFLRAPALGAPEARFLKDK